MTLPIEKKSNTDSVPELLLKEHLLLNSTKTVSELSNFYKDDPVGGLSTISQNIFNIPF